MHKLLMITGDRALAEGKRGAFYNTLEEFHKYWDRVDIICPPSATANCQLPTTNYFGNVFLHPSPWPLIFQPFWILKKGREIYRQQKFNLMTVHEYAPFYNGIGARFLWHKIKVAYLLEIHHVPGYPRPAGLQEWVYEKLFRLGIRFDAAKARAVRVVNWHHLPGYLVRAGVPRKKILLIPSFYIDLEIFKPMDLAKQYDLIFVGRLAANKGVEIFLEAAAELDGKDVPGGARE